MDKIDYKSAYESVLIANGMLRQENKELIEILKTIRHDINFAELCNGYLIEDKLNELEGGKNGKEN